MEIATKKKRKSPFKICFIVSVCIGSSLIIAFCLLLLFHCIDISFAAGMISNVISIVLGIISIAYTYFSGKQTLENLTDIKRQYSSFEKKINSDLAYSNKDEENLDAVSDSYIKLLNSSEGELDKK